MTGGHPSHCHKLTVLFSTGDEAFHFSTCGKQLTISEKIVSEEAFAVGLDAVIRGKSFTTV